MPYAMINTKLQDLSCSKPETTLTNDDKERGSELKKKDLIMIATILVTALALWGGMFLMRKGDYGSVRITVNGLEYGTYSLAKDQGDRHWRYKCLQKSKMEKSK